MIRNQTKKVKVGNIYIGGQDDIIIQSMTTFKTSDIENNIKQIKELESIGCQLIRVSVLDEDDCKAIKEIKKRINIPLVADIHFSTDLAIKAIENGADKIRINPGRFKIDDLGLIIDKAKEYDIPIRIGVNYGSIDPEYLGLSKSEAMLNSLDKYIKLFEEKNFYNIVLAVKSSDVDETVYATKLVAEKYPYPIHIGITEAGDFSGSVVKSSYALGNLICSGIGDTIRVSINGNRKEEIVTCKELLRLFKIRNNIPELIACPTCGRCKINTHEIVKEVRDYLNTINKKIKVAIMGCEVNGPGEAKDADIGIAGGNNCAILFKKGTIIKKIQYCDILETIKKEIKDW